MTGIKEEIIPIPSPEMINVAGPVSELSAIFRVGLYSSEVKYSVALPITIPTKRPTTIANQTPTQFWISSNHKTPNAPRTISIELVLIPRDSELSKFF